jgi:Fe-S cluster assembly ATP-binding protein
VHILVKGRIVASGGPELAAQLDIDGYAAFQTPEPVAPKPKANINPFADPFA